MGISTIGRTLQGIDAFEKLEAAYFGSLSERATDQGAVLLASWLAGRKPHIPAVLACYRPAALDIIVKSPIFEEIFEADGEGFFESRKLADAASADSVLDVAIECGRLFIECARHLAEQRLSLEVRDFAKTLEAIALREIKELKKIKAMHYF